MKGDASGQIEVVGVTADQRIKPGENVLTAGGDLIFPRGLPVGVVEKVVPDPDSDGLIDIIVKPAAHLDRLDEVLVITSTEPRFSPQEQQDMATSVDEKGAQAAAMSDQMKASQIMAEKLPGLIDPNLPADQQPLYDTSNPNPATRPPQPLHPDEFSPGAAYDAAERGTGSELRCRDRSPEERRRPSRGRSDGPAAAPPAGSGRQVQASNAANRKRRRRGIHSHGLARRRLPARFRDPSLSAAGLRAGSACCAGVAGVAAARCWAAMTGSTCRWWSRFILHWAAATRSRAPLMGAAMGLFEDALSHHAIGINGIAKTVVGFLAASVGIRIEVENHAIRLLLNFVLSLLSSAIYLFVTRFMLGLTIEWSWLTELFRAVGNSLIALVLFPLLDRLQDQGSRKTRDRSERSGSLKGDSGRMTGGLVAERTAHRR